MLLDRGARPWWLVLLSLFLVGLPLLASAPPPSYLRVVGAGDPVPGAPPGTTFLYADYPQLAGDMVVFFGQSISDGQWVFGFYVWDGQLVHRIADTTMSGDLPGTTSDTVFSLSETMCDVGSSGLVVCALEGSTIDDPYRALLAWEAGTLTAWGLAGDPAPGGAPGATFVSFGPPRIQGDSAYFAAHTSDSPSASWYLGSGGVLSRLPVEPMGLLGTPAPTPGPLWATAYEEANPTPTSGIYRWDREFNEWSPELLFSSPIPGGAAGDVWIPQVGERSQIGALDQGATFVAYASVTPGLWGVYRTTNGVPELVAGEQWVEPTTDQVVGEIGETTSSSGERIAFQAFMPDQFAQYGLYVQEADRSFRPVAVPGQDIGGVIVRGTSIRPGSLDGDRLAFGIGSFTSSAIWIADLGPTPGYGVEIPTLGREALVVLLGVLALVGMTLVRKGKGQLARRGDPPPPY